MARPHVYVLGAGASYASAGTPLGYELVWDHQASSHAFGLSSEPFRKFLRLCECYFPELQGALQLFEEHERESFLFFGDSARQWDMYCADELLSILIAEGNTENISLLRTLIAEHIITAGFDRCNCLYNSFADYVTSQAAQPFIISLNFDFKLERALRKPRAQPSVLDYGMLFDWTKEGPGPSRPAKTLPIAKLHGSLHWAFCSSCESLGLHFPHLHPGHYRKAICPVCSNTPLEPFIVMPHEEVPHKVVDVWEKATQALQEAAAVTIIGYSFPEYDTTIRNLFRRNTAEDARIFVVDLACEREAKIRRHQLVSTYADILPGRDVSIRLNGFEGFLATVADED